MDRPTPAHLAPRLRPPRFIRPGLIGPSLAGRGDVLRLAVLGDRAPGDPDVELLELLHDIDVAQRVLLVLVLDQPLDALDHAPPGFHGPVALHRPAREEELQVEDAT